MSDNEPDLVENISLDDDDDDQETPNVSTTLEPLEMEAENEEEMEDFQDEDTESLLQTGRKKIQRGSKDVLPPYLQCIPIRPQQVGNMYILFPEQFHGRNNPWGVMGPQPLGPIIIWLLLAVATHYIAKLAAPLGPKLGPISELICYIFFAASTYFLTDICLRDPGICLNKEIPETISSEEARKWRWCDFCQVYQPPDGAHCPDCNVCIAGYDHHCVWMGTCVGKRNYRQFLKFNMSWLYFFLYTLVWVVIIGAFIRNP